MFKSKKNLNKEASIASNEMNHIAAGTKIIGDITAKGNFRLDGELEGDLMSESRVVLGVESQLKGKIIAQNADISGKLIGSVAVSEELILRKTASIEGDIITESIKIESGAYFNGSTQMKASQ